MYTYMFVCVYIYVCVCVCVNTEKNGIETIFTQKLLQKNYVEHTQCDIFSKLK